MYILAAVATKMSRSLYKCKKKTIMDKMFIVKKISKIYLCKSSKKTKKNQFLEGLL